MNTIISLLIAITVITAGASLGRCTRKLWRGSAEATLSDLPMDTSIGIGMLSLIIFAFGLLQLFSGAYKWVLLGLILALAIYKAPGIYADIFRVIKKSLKKPKSLVYILTAVLLFVLFICVLIPALAPPAMDDWDSLAYHLTVPKLYLNHGGIYYINFLSHSNFPLLMDMLYIPGLALNSVVGAKLINFFTWLLLLASAAVLVKKHISEKSVPLALIIIAGTPIMLWEATTAYIDLSTALYTLICVHFIFDYFESDDIKALIGCALSAGFCASTKMTGLAMIPLIALWMAFKRKKIKNIVVFKLLAALICAPWYIKTFILTGNPVYPFFYSIFGGRDWTPELAAIYSSSQAKFGMGHSFVSLVMLPFNLFMHSDKFYDTPGLFIGPIFLIGIPMLLVLIKEKSAKLRSLAVFFIANVLIWFALTHQSRYLIPAVCILAVLVAAINSKLENLKLIQNTIFAVFYLTAIFGAFTIVPLVLQRTDVALGKITQDQYLERSLDVYGAEHYMNENLPKNAKVAFFGDTRGFYLDREFVWADSGITNAFPPDYKSADDFIADLRKKGITHAMINFRFFPKYKDAQGTSKKVYKAIMDGKLEPIYPFDADFSRVTVLELR